MNRELPRHFELFIDSNVFVPISKLGLRSTKKSKSFDAFWKEKLGKSTSWNIHTTPFALVERLGLRKKLMRVASFPGKSSPKFESAEAYLCAAEAEIKAISSIEIATIQGWLNQAANQFFEQLPEDNFVSRNFHSLIGEPVRTMAVSIRDSFGLDRAFALDPHGLSSKHRLTALWQLAVMYLNAPTDSLGVNTVPNDFVYNTSRLRIFSKIALATVNSEALSATDRILYEKWSSLVKTKNREDLYDTELVHSCSWGVKSKGERNVLRATVLTADEPNQFIERVKGYYFLCRRVAQRIKEERIGTPIPSLEDELLGRAFFFDSELNFSEEIDFSQLGWSEAPLK